MGDSCFFFDEYLRLKLCVRGSLFFVRWMIALLIFGVLSNGLTYRCKAAKRPHMPAIIMEDVYC